MERVVNIVECDGGICVSVNRNDRRYYARYIRKSRRLKIKRYKV